MNHWFRSVLVLLLLGLAWPSVARAGTVTGTIRYLRDFADCSSIAGARGACSQNGQMLPLDSVSLNLQRVSDGANNFFFAAENGTFSKSVPAGTYRLGIQYRDGTIDTPGTLGNAGVALVNESVPPYTDVYDTAGNTMVVSASGTVTWNVNLNASFGSDVSARANTYAMLMLQQRVWERDYIGAWFNEPGSGLFRARVKNVSAVAAGGVYCLNGNTYDCVMVPQIQFALRSTSTTWHEIGHGMQRLLQYYVFGNAWMTTPTSGYSPACAGAGETASRALEEGWADAVAILTQFAPANIPQYAVGGVCSFCAYPPTGNQPNAPACGTGTIVRSPSAVTKGILELVDTSQGTEAGCRAETVQVTPATLIDALTRWGGAQNQCVHPATCTDMCGVEEGGIAEGWLCAPSTPGWPYTGANALRVPDQLSFLDFLDILRDDYGVNSTQLRNVWANTCWQPGDTDTAFP